ncbi:MAG: peptidoglycan editing factor PgeF [Alphaproteobacteria bacterium]|nr:peptidoglycan editing factor PgeF [Alphaproteobacteria bacterium]
MTQQPAPLASAALSPAGGVRHGFFTRTGGVSGGLYAALNCGYGSADRRTDVAENRARAARALDARPERLITVHQTHSARVLVAEDVWQADQAPRADALATRARGLALGILTADCAPVLLADAEAGVIGAAHAGWRGAADGIVEAVVAAMRRLGARPERITAAIGPCIQQASYQVGEDMRAAVLARDAGASDCFVADDSARFRFDLPGYVARRLAAAGIGAIGRLAEDTYGDAERFFSYRRATHCGQADYGRALSVIVLD